MPDVRSKTSCCFCSKGKQIIWKSSFVETKKKHDVLTCSPASPPLYIKNSQRNNVFPGYSRIKIIDFLKPRLEINNFEWRKTKRRWKLYALHIFQPIGVEIGGVGVVVTRTWHERVFCCIRPALMERLCMRLLSLGGLRPKTRVGVADLSSLRYTFGRSK